MQNQRVIRFSFCLGFSIMSIAIVLVPIVVCPPSLRPDTYWYMILWTEALNTIVWISLALFAIPPGLQTKSTSQWGGAAATIPLVTVTYAVCSFLLMITHAMLFQSELSSRIHLGVQILLCTAAVLGIVLLAIARSAHGAGFTESSKTVPAPKDLHDLLGFHESLFHGADTEGLKGSIKQLRETVRYSLHDSLLVSQLSEYQQLASEIEELCQSLARIPNNTADTMAGERIDGLHESVIALTAKVESVSTKQVRS